jgi:hypothetical protein
MIFTASGRKILDQPSYTGQQGMIFEENLMLSSFVDNKVGYYRKMLLLVILKGLFSHLIYGTWCV